MFGVGETWPTTVYRTSLSVCALLKLCVAIKQMQSIHLLMLNAAVVFSLLTSLLMSCSMVMFTNITGMPIFIAINFKQHISIFRHLVKSCGNYLLWSYSIFRYKSNIPTTRGMWWSFTEYSILHCLCGLCRSVWTLPINIAEWHFISHVMVI